MKLPICQEILNSRENRKIIYPSGGRGRIGKREEFVFCPVRKQTEGAFVEFGCRSQRAPHEPPFVYSEGGDFGLQSLMRNSELCCGTTGT